MGFTPYIIVTGVPWIDANLQVISDVLAKNWINVYHADKYVMLIGAFGFLIMAIAIELHIKLNGKFILNTKRNDAWRPTAIACGACAFLEFVTLITYNGKATTPMVIIVIIMGIIVVAIGSVLTYNAERSFKSQGLLMQLVGREIFAILTLIAAYAPILTILLSTELPPTTSWLFDRIILLIQCLILTFLPYLALRIAIFKIKQSRHIRRANRSHSVTTDDNKTIG